MNIFLSKSTVIEEYRDSLFIAEIMATAVKLNVSEKDPSKTEEKKDLFINLSKASPKSSPAWNFFGFLWINKPSKKIVASTQKRVFCKVCFDKLDETDTLTE